MMCANMLNLDALRRTKKRSFEDVVEVLAENVSVPMMRQWNRASRLGVRNISRTTDKTDWSTKALKAILKK